MLRAAASTACALIALSACNNDRAPMGRVEKPVARTPFLGPIPDDFRNTGTEESFSVHAVAESQVFGPVLARFPGTPGGLKITAEDPQSVAPGPLLNDCANVRALAGGFMTAKNLRSERDGITIGFTPGADCAQTLADLGSSIPGVATALSTQATNLGALQLQPDACTDIQPKGALPQDAVKGFQLTPVADQGFGLAAGDLRGFEALVEGGEDPDRLAFRTEVDLGARDSYQWAAVAALVHPGNRQIVAEKGERLDLGAETLIKRATFDITYGAQPILKEHTTLRYRKDRTELKSRELTVTAQIIPNSEDVRVDAQSGPAGQDPVEHITFRMVLSGQACTVQAEQ